MPILSTCSRVAVIAGQALGLIAALAGLYLLAGLGWSLLACGLALVGLCTAWEAAALRRPVVPSAPRSGPILKGVE